MRPCTCRILKQVCMVEIEISWVYPVNKVLISFDISHPLKMDPLPAIPKGRDLKLYLISYPSQ